MTTTKDATTLFTFQGTPVKVKPILAANLLALWGGLSWWAGRRRPERPWPLRLAVGALSTVALLVVDVGHAMAHVVSARCAEAPMDEILVSEGMPRTIYYDDDVPPRAHRTRALGGPIYSALGLLASLGLRAVTPRQSAARELVDLSALGHGLILAGSLAPLPIVDGGSLLKWTLVDTGRTPEEADAVVRQVNLGLGASLLATGVAVAATGLREGPARRRRRWLPALGLVAAGGIALAAGLGKLR